MRRTSAFAALLAAACLLPASHGHLLEQGHGCSSDFVPVYTTPNWVKAWAQDPIDESNLTSDPAGHGLNSVGRTEDPCIEFRIPCVSPRASCPIDD